MHIPTQFDILARALDCRSDALRQRDTASVRGFDALIVGVVCGYAQLRWEYQYLLVASASHPGAIHAVSAYGCSCEARKPCWHQRLRELLLSIADTDVETADMAADPPLDIPDEYPDPSPGGPEPPEWRTFGARIAAARRNYAYAL